MKTSYNRMMPGCLIPVINLEISSGAAVFSRSFLRPFLTVSEGFVVIKMNVIVYIESENFVLRHKVHM